MGQRLVISVKRNVGDKKCLSKLYWHWSGYTNSSFQVLEDLTGHLTNIKGIEKKSDKEINLILIRYLESIGGGIDQKKEEIKYTKKLYPKEKFKKGKDINRSNGLIAISKEVQNDMQELSNGDVELGIDDKKVMNYVNFVYDSLEELNQERKEEELPLIEEKNILEIDYDLEEMNWSDTQQANKDTQEYDYLKYKNKYYVCWVC